MYVVPNVTAITFAKRYLHMKHKVLGETGKWGKEIKMQKVISNNISKLNVCCFVNKKIYVMVLESCITM